MTQMGADGILMKPTWEKNGVQLYLGDCREILPTLGVVDAVITDPPYGIGWSKRSKWGGSNLAQTKDYGIQEWDCTPPSKETIDALRGMSQWQIFFGGNYFELPPTPCWLVWDKETGDNHFADAELAWTNLKGAVRLIRYRWAGMLRENNETRGDHPTQKAVGVMEWAISKLPEPSSTILDPFMGSGTTGVAAVRLNRKFIGIERESQYFDIAQRRIEAAMEETSLLDYAQAIAHQLEITTS